MATIQNKDIKVSMGVRTKIETTYEWKEIFGVFGYWRTAYVNRMGDKIELHLNTPLREFDDVFINGEKINIETKSNE